MNLNELSIKNRKGYYFDDMIKIEDFDLDNIFLDEKSYENTLSCTKLSLVQNLHL